MNQEYYEPLSSTHPDMTDALAKYKQLVILQQVGQQNIGAYQTLTQRQDQLHQKIASLWETAGGQENIRLMGNIQAVLSVPMAGKQIINGLALEMLGTASLVTGDLGKAINEGFSMANDIIEGYQNPEIADAKYAKIVGELTKNPILSGTADAAEIKAALDKNNPQEAFKSILSLIGTIAEPVNEEVAENVNTLAQLVDGFNKTVEGARTTGEAFTEAAEQIKSTNQVVDHSEKQTVADYNFYAGQDDEIQNFKEVLDPENMQETGQLVDLYEQQMGFKREDLDPQEIENGVQAYSAQINNLLADKPAAITEPAGTTTEPAGTTISQPSEAPAQPARADSGAPTDRPAYSGIPALNGDSSWMTNAGYSSLLYAAFSGIDDATSAGAEKPTSVGAEKPTSAGAEKATPATGKNSEGPPPAASGKPTGNQDGYSNPYANNIQQNAAGQPVNDGYGNTGSDGNKSAGSTSGDSHAAPQAESGSQGSSSVAETALAALQGKTGPSAAQPAHM